MTNPSKEEREAWASDLRAKWDANEYEIHKRPPFKAHSFDTNDKFWVVGSTYVSVLHGWHGSQETAEKIASALNFEHHKGSST